MSTKMRRVESRGASLIEILGWVAFGLLLLFGILFFIERALAPSVALIGPPQIVSGDPNQGEFRVTLQYRSAFEATTRVKVEIFENDFFGNELLAEVIVTIPENVNVGSALFKLTCDETGLKGAKGASASESTWQIFARVVKQDASRAADSANKDVMCVQPSGQ